MPINVQGDKEFDKITSIQNKALRINLNENIYGTFAEIGAGQETVRNFFRAPNPSGTIAKTMSAYDKDFSDAIYGAEPAKRYVTEPRLKAMMAYETGLIEKRISRLKHPNKLFFSFANTVATIDWAKKYKGHGWIGIRFQTKPKEEYSEIILHVQLHENKAAQQQISLGIMGVNLIYAAYYHHDDPKVLLKRLYDHLSADKIEVDTINFTGPAFKDVDNRLMSLQLVKNGMTDAVMFAPSGNNVLPANVLYKKNILTLRGSFRPVTKVNISMYEKSLRMFMEDHDIQRAATEVIFEITLFNLKGEGDEIDERDFLNRADLLCALGHTVMISNFQQYYKVVNYFAQFTSEQIGLTMGVTTLQDIFDNKYYTNLSGGILEAFGSLFARNVNIYLYPSRDEETGEIYTTKNLRVNNNTRGLYNFFKQNDRIINITDYDEETLDINSRKVHEMITEEKSGWEDMLPEKVTDLIKTQQMFRKKN
ncbi:TonB-dependent receptor [Zunongwangia sp. HGR-M22]|uniref:TonB-dependent receptor n=1 Tax=Zunongwangia sp. HGR-M22 TaxID=3015168 RepID=UPI0022DE2DA5|nr:TonB-dependent receptor [Zunongwangia sp. HGR-M22]WBL25169.1 TonB-dependent receptor [Zunongwangia sp. HGR-M22]